MPSPSRAPGVFAVLLLVALAVPLAAQGSARIQGVVYDSVKSRPLAGALVTIVQVAPEPQRFFAVNTDSTGAYHVDSLTAGRYRVEFTTPFLDSLEIQYPPHTLALAAGEQARLDFATPSRETLAQAACPGVSLAKGRGAIIGQVMNAETDTPLAGATIAVSWMDVGLDLKAMKATAQARNAAVTADSLGRYRVCGLPTDTYILLQVQQQDKAGSPFRAVVADDAGVRVHNLSLSVAAAREFSAADSTGASARDTVTRRLTGTATATGTVRTPEGEPVGGAQLRVVDGVTTARTDAAGHFELNALPAGTQVLEVRRVGFLLAQQPVELRANRSVATEVRLTRIVTLDSVRIVAQRGAIAEFERRAAHSAAAGSILRAADLTRMNISETADVFRGRILGFAVVGDGVDAKVQSTRGQIGMRGACVVNIVIDGMQNQEINIVPPSAIAGMEIYRGPPGAPPGIDAACGAIMIWTKR